MSVSWIAIEPLDTISARDGRPFDAGASAGEPISHSSGVMPSTALGAAWSAYAMPRNEYDKSLTFVGPIAATQSEGTVRAFFPWPSDVVVDDDDLYGRLTVAEPLAEQSSAPTPKLLVSEWDSPLGMVTDAGSMTAYLAGGIPSVCLTSILHSDFHIGLQRQDRVAVDSMLYGAEHLRLEEGGFYVGRIRRNGNRLAPGGHLARLGGEGRLAEFTVLDNPVPMPEAPDHFPDGRLLLYLASPAIWSDGWKPPTPEHATLEAASVDGPLPVAMWGKTANAANASGAPDLDRPFVLRWAVTAGSVYYYRFATEVAAKKFSKRWHDRCYTQAEGRLRTAGYGWCFTGTWKEN